MYFAFTSGILVLVSLFFGCGMPRGETSLVMEGARLSLAGEDLSQPRTVRGEWHVFVGERVTPEEVRERSDSSLITVPPRERRYYTPWGERLVAGSITFHGEIVDIPPGAQLALAIPLTYGTLCAWVNDREVIPGGYAGVETNVLVPIVPDESGRARVVICIGSTHYPYSGLTFLPPRLGSTAALQRTRTVLAFRDGLLIGMVLIVAAYHLLLVFSPDRDTPNLYLSLFALVLAFRFAVGDGEMLLGVLMNLSAETMMRLKGPSLYMVFPAYLVFLRRMYPGEWRHGAARLVLPASIVWTAASLVVPLHWWMDLLFWHYPVAVFALAVVGAILVRAVLAGRDGARTITAGYVVLLLAGLVETLRLTGWVHVPLFHCLSVGATVFLIANSLVVSRRMAGFRISLANLREQAQTDGLTGLFNRRTFDFRLQEEWSRHVRSRRPLALMMVDVDHFKRYNDSLGHQAGDEALRTVARILRGHAQRAGDVVARYGGEEFVLILPDTDVAGAYKLAEAVREGIRGHAVAHPDSPRGILTISVGVAAVIPEYAAADALEARHLVTAADRAVYDAKMGGRDAVRTAAVEPC